MPRTSSTASRVALSLSVLAAAGCASFDPNPAATSGAPGASGAPPVAVAASPAPTPPAAGPAEVPAVVPDFLVGLASLADEPIANAPFTVLDALTNEPITGARQVTIDGVLPPGSLRTDANGLILFTLPKDYPGSLVRVAVQTPEGAFLNTLLVVTPTAKGYRLMGTTSTCGSNPIPVRVSATVEFTGISASDFDQTDYREQFTQSLADALNIDQDRISLTGPIEAGYRLAADDACTPSNAFKLDFTSTLASGAMCGVVGLLKAGLANNGTVSSLLAAAQNSAKAIDDKFGENAASQKAAYAAYTKDPGANEGFGLGIAYKQVENMLEAAGVPKTQLATTVAETFSALLKKLEANPVDLTGLTITQNDLPTNLNLNVNTLKTGTISYTDPTTNELVTVKVGDPQPDAGQPSPSATDPQVTFTDEPDFLTDAAKLAPTVTVNYQEGDATSPLRLTVAQAGDTFDVKTITASIPRTYVKTLNLAAAAQINDTTTVTDPSGAASGWSTLTGGLPHRVTATSPAATATAFTGDWRFGGPPGTKIADVVIKSTDAAVTVDLTFALTGNNAVRTKGGQVVMDILKSVIDLDLTQLKALPQDSDNVVSITIASRSGKDLSPTTTETDAAVNYTRPVTILAAP